MAAPSAHETFRTSLVLWGLMLAYGGISLALLWGHLKGHFNLYHLPMGIRTGQIEWRLLGEILAFPLGGAAVLIAAIRSHPDLWLILAVYLGTYAARSVAGALAGAKASVMTGGGFGGNRYGATSTTMYQGPVVRGRVDGGPTP